MPANTHPIRHSVAATALVAAVVAVPASAEAQFSWLELEGTGVALEYRRISDDDFDMDPLSGVYYLLGHANAGRELQVVAELPFARFGAGDEPLFGEDDPTTALGNVYLGVRRPSGGGRSAFDVGVRVPTMDGDDFTPAGAIGQLSSVLDRFGAFSPESFVITGGAGGSTHPSESAELRGRLGIVYYKYLGDFDVDDQAIARLTGQALMGFDAFRLGGGLETLFVLTGDGNAGERSLIGATLMGRYDFGPVLLGAQLHLPVDEDYKNFADRIFGLSVEVGL